MDSSQLLVTESGILCTAFLAPAPPIAPYTLGGDGRENIDIYYICVASLYRALCGGGSGGTKHCVPTQLDADVQLYCRSGSRTFRPISIDEIQQRKMTQRDLYISYAQCVAVMFGVVKQLLEHSKDPDITNGIALHEKALTKVDMVSTMYWIQNLEHAIPLIYARIVKKQLPPTTEKQSFGDERYTELALPHVYMLYQRHITHQFMKTSNHPLAKRKQWPFLAFCVEGHVLYNSLLACTHDCYRTPIMQRCLVLALNDSLDMETKALCAMAEAAAEDLIRSEMEEQVLAQRKSEKKRHKRQREKQRQKERKALKEKEEEEKRELVKAPPPPPISTAGVRNEEEDDDSIIFIMDEGFGDSLRKLKALHASSPLSPFAAEFIPRYLLFCPVQEAKAHRLPFLFLV